jgi:DNA-binding LacI/PurR family transcriptional regulator
MGVVKEARESGSRVPEDLSITGFDDLSSDFHFEPFVTSVRFSRHEMGRRAVELIARDSEAAGESSDVKFEHETVPVELAIRSSTSAI